MYLEQDQKMMIVMLLVVMALLMSRDTHKLFAETTRTWAQFGANNYKAIVAITSAAFFLIGDIYKRNKQNDPNRQAINQNNQQIITASQLPPPSKTAANVPPHYDTHGEATDVYEPYPDVVDSPLRMHVNLN